MVEEQLTIVTFGWPVGGGQGLLQWRRSSNLGRFAGGGAGAAPWVVEQQTAATLAGLQRGRSCFSGGGAATLGGLREEGQELLQGWRSGDL